MTIKELSKIVLNGFEQINNKIDGLEKRMDKLESRMDILEQKLDNHIIEYHSIKS